MSIRYALSISNSHRERVNQARIMKETLASKDDGDSKSVHVTTKTVRSCNSFGPETSISTGESHVNDPSRIRPFYKLVSQTRSFIVKYVSFIGPGFMIAVSYIDPGNYATDVSAGAKYRFYHLFVVLLSNVFAIFLQSLCIKLGSVTGTDLATNCRRNLPRWLNICVYIIAETAIIATDLGEVLGTAIALQILIKIPLVAGVALTMVDVIIILYFYRPNGPLKAFRYFEIGITFLVLGVIICFCIELSKITGTSFPEVMRGYLPSKAIISSEGLYLSCGILGATVMPHSLYLGSGIVQPRLRDFDHRKGYFVPDETEAPQRPYFPSLQAIRYTMNYCIADLTASLTTCALFVNSAILIVSGATLSNNPDAANADLFTIHDLLSKSIGKAAGTIFALALLLSGQSAGIVVTLAGQMVCEGHLNWNIKPWIRRLVTRAIAITPCIAVAAALGRNGIGQALQASQVTLSILLPFLTAPLMWFTCHKKYMKVKVYTPLGEEEREVEFSNGWLVTAVAICVWTFVAGLNSYLVISLAMGKGG